MRNLSYLFLSFFFLSACGNPLGSISSQKVDTNFHPGWPGPDLPVATTPSNTPPSGGMAVGSGGTLLSAGLSISANAAVPSKKILATGTQVRAQLSITN